MSTNVEGPLNSGTDGPKPVRRLQTGMRTLLVLVACCAAILWAWRHSSENSDPVLVEARSIQKRAISALRSNKPADRLTAIVELDRLHSGDSAIAIPPLIASLDDPVTEVRRAAAEALRSISSSVGDSRSGGETARAAAMALIGCLKNSDAAIRVTAVNALGEIGFDVGSSGSDGETVRASATALIGCSKDPEPRVRSAATIALGRIVSPMLASTTSAPIDRKVVMDALVEVLGDRDAGVRGAAIHAMVANPDGNEHLPRVLAQGLEDESAENRAAAVSSLPVRGQGLDPWVPILLRLAEHDPDPAVREQCFRTLSYASRLSAITAAAVPALVTSLKSADVKVRSQAASILMEFKADARAAIPELIRTLNEPLDPQVVARTGPGTFDPGCAAARALGRIAPGSAKAKEAIAALMEVARSGPPSRRGWATFALGEFGPAAQEAVPVLLKVIKEATLDDKFEAEAGAASSLGKIAPNTQSADQAVVALLPVLKSKPTLSRTTAIEALGQFGRKASAAIPQIRALKDDRDRDIRDAAARALLAIEIHSAP